MKKFFALHLIIIFSFPNLAYAAYCDDGDFDFFIDDVWELDLSQDRVDGAHHYNFLFTMKKTNFNSYKLSREYRFPKSAPSDKRRYYQGRFSTAARVTGTTKSELYPVTISSFVLKNTGSEKMFYRNGEGYREYCLLEMNLNGDILNLSGGNLASFSFDLIFRVYEYQQNRRFFSVDITSVDGDRPFAETDGTFQRVEYK